MLENLFFKERGKQLLTFEGEKLVFFQKKRGFPPQEKLDALPLGGKAPKLE